MPAGASAAQGRRRRHRGRAPVHVAARRAEGGHADDDVGAARPAARRRPHALGVLLARAGPQVRTAAPPTLNRGMSNPSRAMATPAPAAALGDWRRRRLAAAGFEPQLAAEL